MIKITQEGLTRAGAPLAVGQILDLDPATEAAYVSAGKASYVSERVDTVATRASVGKVIGDDELPMTGKVDAVTGRIDFSVNGSDALAASFAKNTPMLVTDKPWQFATWGDSRSVYEQNVTSPNLNATGAVCRTQRAAAWVVGFLNGAEITRNYGVSGDNPDNWASTTRAILGGTAGSSSIYNLVAEDVDGVIIQYGINGVLNWTVGSPALPTFVAQQIAYHKGYLSEVIKSGKRVVWEEINPCTLANFGGNPAKQDAVDQINAAVGSWLANFPKFAVVAKTAAALKNSSGYANTAYYADGTHFNINGARVAGEIIAKAAKSLFREKGAMFYSPLLTGPNFIDLANPDVFTVAETGGVSGLVTTTGIDSAGWYIEHSYTPQASTRFRMATNGRVGTATPRYPIAIGDVVQGSARIYVDDGVGGPANANNIALRHRIYGGSGVYAGIGDLTITSDAPTKPVDVQWQLPRLTSAMASASIADVALSQGYALEVFVTSPNPSPVRVRIYNPSLRKVG